MLGVGIGFVCTWLSLVSIISNTEALASISQALIICDLVRFNLCLHIGSVHFAYPNCLKFEIYYHMMQKTKKQMETTRDQLAEALYQKGLALSEIESLKV